MTRLSSRVWVLLAALPCPMASPIQGQDTVCIGSRAHTVKYALKGDSLENLEDAVVSVTPDRSNSGVCAPASSGDKALCVGANQDVTCSEAEKDLPLRAGFDCSNCFAGATTDLFYRLDVKGFSLQEVEVGLQRTHIRSAAEVHGAGAGTKPLKGQFTLLDKTAKISFKVAKILPVDITVGLPTTLAYSVGLTGSFDATAGADLDIDLGDHFVKWTKTGGFSAVNDSPNVTVTPKLAVDAKAEADLSLSLQSSAQIDVDKVIWYHLNMAPSLPVAVSLNDKDTEVCANGGVDLTVGHEADVHFTLFGKKHEISHFGPKEIYHYHKDAIMHKCVGIPKPAIIV